MNDNNKKVIDENFKSNHFMIIEENIEFQILHLLGNA